jgi:tetratricopeptide (TPR) repeat protein
MNKIVGTLLIHETTQLNYFNLPFLDALCITVIGTTHNLQDFIDSSSIPVKLYYDTWKNIGYNKNQSMLHVKEWCNDVQWDMAHTYAFLLQLNMNVVINLDKETLRHPCYKIQSYLDSYCSLLVRLDTEIDEITPMPPSIMYLDIEKPFKLAQTYQANGDYEKAIQMYSKVKEPEEAVWYSYYMISHCYLKLDHTEDFEKWALLAGKLRKRSEPFYDLVDYFRTKGQYYKAYQYYLEGVHVPYPSKDTMEVNKFIYENGFHYQYALLQYYVFPNERIDGLKYVIEHYTTDMLDTVEYYIPRLLDVGTKTSISLPTNPEFTPSSISLLQRDKDILANIRFVSYNINPEGQYIFSGPNIKTRNAYVSFNERLEAISPLTYMKDTLADLPSHDRSCLGLEDIRLFAKENRVHYTATTMEYSYNDTIRIVTGEYDMAQNECINNTCLIPPTETTCEKNWIVMKENIIYKWHPLQVGVVTGNQLHIRFTKPTPPIFNRYRGSTHGIEFQNEYWFVTHGIMDCFPRKYFHQLVVLDTEFNLKRYTVPFYFDTFAVEYCIGFLIVNDVLLFTASRNDSNPIFIQVPIKSMDSYFTY